jgi:hypothetical protein
MTTPQIYAFTSAACNYLPKVRLLLESLRRYHPEMRLVLALSDRLPDPELVRGEAWDEIMPVESLDIPDWERWAFTHNIVELSTAIKPFVLRRLLDRPDCAGVFYFDPDMVLFSRLDDLIDRLAQGSVVLTPHQTKPETGLERVIDNEICSLKVGTYNLGFVGVRPTPPGRDFARWWSERVYYFCRDDIPNGLFTDQKWIDLAPALFDGVQIVRSSRFNVAPWNLTTRQLSGNLDGGFMVDGEPLGFYHFTGFDSGAHRIMVGKYCGTNPSAMSLVDWYQKATSGLEDDPLTSQPWAFGQFSDGSPINRAHRLIYRSRADLQQRFPAPFSTVEKGGFATWCRQAGASEYPDLLPKPKANADWSKVEGHLTPSLAAPATDLPPLSARFRAAATDARLARLLFQQIIRVLRREGLAGLIRRTKQAMR